jgi:hypothetical protein
MPEYTGYARETVTSSDAELVTRAESLLQQGKDHRQGLREQVWDRVRLQYEGAHWDTEATEDPTADLTVVNLSFATIQTIKPYITDREPRFYLEPFSSDATRLSAALQEVFLNRIWRHPPVGAQVALRAAAFDFLTFGDGFLKGTYTVATRMSLDGEDVERIELHVDRTSPWDIWIDPYALGVDTARWVAHRIWMTELEAKADARLMIPAGYEFTDRRLDNDDRQHRSNAGLRDEQRWVELIEFYDVAQGIMIAFPHSGASSESEASTGQLPWRIVDDMALPIVQIPNYDIPDSPWHIGELENITKLQEELNKTRSELMTHRRRNVAKTFVRKSVVDSGAGAALQSPIVNEMVMLDTQEPLQNVVIPYQGTPLTADNYQASREIKDDIREITGITEYQRGIAPEITRTATEASIMDAAANTKLQSKLTAIEEAARRLGVILLGISREVFPETEPDEWAMFIGGDEAQRLARMAQETSAGQAYDSGDVQGAMDVMSQQLPNQVTLKPTDQMFSGQYEVLVEVGSTEYRDPKLRQERMKEMFFEIVNVAPALAQMGVQVDVNRLARLWLESTDIIDVDSLLAPSGPQAMPGTPQEMGAGAANAPPPQPSPEELAMIENTGMLDTGQIAPAVPGYGDVA